MLRAAMGKAAVKAARAADYEGAGTVEFLLDAAGIFSFMEMNTRVQVEHPHHRDGHRHRHRQGADPHRRRRVPVILSSEVEIEGHAIEFRINAEDPESNFLPTPGVVTRWVPPGGPWVRLDTHVYEGYQVPPFYDSLLAKLIVWGRSRDEALGRARGPSTSSWSRASRRPSRSTAASSIIRCSSRARSAPTSSKIT